VRRPLSTNAMPRLGTHAPSSSSSLNTPFPVRTAVGSGGDRFFMSGFWDDVADVRVAMRMLRRAPYHLQPVCLVGHSLGGQHALQLAASAVLAGGTPAVVGAKHSRAKTRAGTTPTAVAAASSESCASRRCRGRERNCAAALPSPSPTPGTSTPTAAVHAAAATADDNDDDDDDDDDCSCFVPPLLVCVQPRFRLRFWIEEWERQRSSSPDADGQWTLKWKNSRGRACAHVVQKREAESYSAVNMDAVRALNGPRFGGGRLHVLSVYGIATTRGGSSSKSTGSSSSSSSSSAGAGASVVVAATGYGSDEAARTSLDGVVPVEDCTELANRINCDRHTLRMVRFLCGFGFPLSCFAAVRSGYGGSTGWL
jgi:hypothetical protein